MLKGFDVLIQIAAQRNIHQLDAPADGQHRLVSGKEGAQQQRLGGIPQDVGLTAGRDALLPVEFRVDVAAARQQQAVTGQRILHGLSGSSSSIQHISAPARARLSGYLA